jgi:hypothetical protein
MNKIIPLQEMIEEIKKYYNLNDTLLALNLKVTPQTVKGWKDGNIPREKTYNKILEIYNNIINSEEQTKEVTEVTKKKPYEISYPNNGKQIYYISYHSGQVKEWEFDINYEADKYLYDIGIYFDTKEEAEQFKRERALIKKIKCWAKEQQGDWKPDWSNTNQCKYCVGVDRFIKEIICDCCWGHDKLPKLPYFKTEEIAQACIDEFREEILEVFCQ